MAGTTTTATWNTVLFNSTKEAELYQVMKAHKELLGKGMFTVQEDFVQPDPAHYPRKLPVAEVSGVRWGLLPGSVVLRSTSATGQVALLFSHVFSELQDAVLALVLHADTPAVELESLESVLSVHAHWHTDNRSQAARTGSPPGLPQVKLPEVKPEQVCELLRKAAEDTHVVINGAASMLGSMLRAAGDIHKQCAPAPDPQPLTVDPKLKANVARTKAMTSTGAVLARGVCAGVDSASSEVGASLGTMVLDAKKQTGGVVGDQAGGSDTGVHNDSLAMIGAEVAKGVSEVRVALQEASDTVWREARGVTVTTYSYQYGHEGGVLASDVCDIAEGVHNVQKALDATRPDRLAMKTAKHAVKHIAGQQQQQQQQQQEERQQQQPIVSGGMRASPSWA